jgi:hypothetical protein
LRTGRIGSISSAVARDELRAGDLCDQLFRLRDELFVTLPAGVPDPVSHEGQTR